MIDKAGIPTTQASLVPTNTPAPGTFEAIFRVLDASSAPVIGAIDTSVLVIPINDDSGSVSGGLWGTISFGWLHITMLFVPEPLRRKGVGRLLMQIAETEACNRECIGMLVDTFSFQAPGFYKRLGFTPYGELLDFPPGHSRIYLCKRLPQLCAALLDATPKQPHASRA